MALIQGGKSVVEYEAEFEKPLRYAPQIAQIEADKARKFGGPQLGIQEKVVSLMLDEYAKVVERE